MRGINKVILLGTLGQDPEISYAGNGTAIAVLSIATNEEWTDKQTGEKQKRTDWHRVKLFGRKAEVAGEYLAKGRPVYVEGRNRTDEYTDDQGNKKYAKYVLCDDLQLLPSGGDGGGQRQGGNSSGNGVGNRTQGGQRGNQARDRQTNLDQRSSYNGQGGNYSAPPQQFDDDDIPF